MLIVDFTPTLPLPLTGRGNTSEPSDARTPSPYKGEGWDGGKKIEGIQKIVIHPSLLKLGNVSNNQIDTSPTLPVKNAKPVNTSNAPVIFSTIPI